MKKRVSLFLVFGLILLGIFSINRLNDNCIDIYVDYGKSNKIFEKCIESNSKTNALDILINSGFKIEGTQKYGNAVVCRVNGFPDRSKESCQDMPPENAFWAVIIKKKNITPLPINDWGWAQKAINETYLNPGDSLGLVFSTNGDLKWPK
jgi:hypothetical protein